jgi:mRNA interferase RelE/StbE
MNYQVIIPKVVQKQLDKLPRDILERLIPFILELQNNPRNPNTLKMKNNEGYRIRVGDYRILYDINDYNKMVIIRRVGHRRDIYRG